MKHEMVITARSLGTRRKGTNLSCSCKQWAGSFSNDKTPEQARKAHWGEDLHARHVASTTTESDIAALKALIVKQQEWLAKDVEMELTSFIPDRIRRLSTLADELIADLNKQAEEN